MSKRNVFFKKDIYEEKVSEDDKLVLDDYIMEMKSKGRSEGTINQYVYDIKGFYCWSAENLNKKGILELKKRDFRRFFLHMQDTGCSSARINRMQCSLRNLLQFCVDDDDEYEDYEINIMSSIKGIEKQEVRDIIFLSDEQVTYLINTLIENNKYQRALYVSLSYDSAARRNEIHQVEKHGFLENTMTNEVVGKRGKKFQLLYKDRTKEIAKKYFEQRGEDDIDSIWISTENGIHKPLQSQTLYSWAVSFRKILEEKYEEEILLNSHSFRHSSLNNYEDGTHYNLKLMGIKNIDVKHLKELANHSSVETTESYLKDKGKEQLHSIFA
ncbi:MAG: tyrosine-type recombinase/integrase [Mammaliicoccus vitulinus]